MRRAMIAVGLACVVVGACSAFGVSRDDGDGDGDGGSDGSVVPGRDGAGADDANGGTDAGADAGADASLCPVRFTVDFSGSTVPSSFVPMLTDGGSLTVDNGEVPEGGAKALHAHVDKTLDDNGSTEVAVEAAGVETHDFDGDAGGDAPTSIHLSYAAYFDEWANTKGITGCSLTMQQGSDSETVEIRRDGNEFFLGTTVMSPSLYDGGVFPGAGYYDVFVDVDLSKAGSLVATVTLGPHGNPGAAVTTTYTQPYAGKPTSASILTCGLATSIVGVRDAGDVWIDHIVLRSCP